ncbi:reverse transcriptase domain-containing protein [Tanacetum coccineum]
MTKKDEEKTTFHKEEGVFCYTKMPFGLKNAGATYQRHVDSAFKEQIRVNLEAYVYDMVIKSRTEQDVIKDIEQTFSTLRRINMKLNPKKCSFGMEEGKFLGYIVTLEGIRANPEKTKAVMDMPSPRTLKQMQSLSGKLAALNHFLSKSAERSLPFLVTLKKCTNKKDFRWTEAAEATFIEMKKLVSELPTLTTSKKGETLMLYLAATNKAVSVKLKNIAAYGDTRSGPSFRARKLRTVKEVLADFLEDTPTEINATPEVASTPRMEDIPDSLNAKENLTPGPRAWRLYTDGAPNNIGSGAGLILIAPNDVEYSYALYLNFSNSNNDAEYEALLAGLRIATEMQVKDIHAFVDSKFVASQVEGSYEAKGERMIKYQEQRKADALSKLAAVQFDHLSKEVLVEVLNECFVEAQEVNMVVEEEGPTWMTPIRNYLEKGILPEDPVDARTLMEKIRNYTIEDGVLYRKSYLVSLMRCVGPLQANYVIRKVHMGSCGMHDGPSQVVAKAMNLGYYWPSMHRDARELWGMDIVGPLPEGPRRVKYLIVATDYFTKWMEAKPLATITGKQVVNFTWDNIGNEAVERANKSLLRGIKTRLEKGGSAWVEEVPNVLWAHQTMKKTSNGETPFSLTYELRLNLDLLEERKEIAAIRKARYKQQVEKYYNKKVRHVQIKVGEFVLRKNEASRAANTGKLGSTWEGPYKVIQAFQSGAYKLSNMEGEEIPRTWHACNLRMCYMYVKTPTKYNNVKSNPETAKVGLPHALAHGLQPESYCGKTGPYWLNRPDPYKFRHMSDK